MTSALIEEINTTLEETADRNTTPTWPEDPEVIKDLREQTTSDQATIKAGIRLMNQQKAYIRRLLGWSPELSEKEMKKLVSDSEKVHKNILKGGDGDGDKLPEDLQGIAVMAKPFVIALQQAKEPLSRCQKRIEKEMVRLVKEASADHVWEWMLDIKGFGPLSLARIIGNAGALSNYANPGKLWKRFGLAPYKGRAMATWVSKVNSRDPEDKLTREEWITAGYSPKRRAVMHVIGDTMIKKSSYLRDTYDARKAYEKARDPEMSDGYAHMRALRYMQKRLLRDLWRQWVGQTEPYVWTPEDELGEDGLISGLTSFSEATALDEMAATE